MHILHLIDATGLYGAERIVLDLMEYQSRRGWSPVLGSIGGTAGQIRPFERVAEARGLAVKKFPMRRGVNLVGGRGILKFAKRSNFDAIHSHSYKGNINIGLLPKFLRSIPFLITLHGWRPPHKLLLRLMQWAERYSFRKADRVIAVHATLAEDERLQNLQSSRLHVVPNGILPIDETENTLDTQLTEDLETFTANRFAIGAIGRLSPEKGFHLLLRAVAGLRRKGLDCVLTIFGEGQERQRLETLVTELDLSTFVRLKGYVPDAIRYRCAFDCVVVPSFAEACPLVALECMQAGVPLVASRAGGLPDMLEEGRSGRLFPVGDETALTRAVLAVVDDKTTTQQQVARGRNVVQEKYSTSRMESEYAEIYREVCKTP